MRKVGMIANLQRDAAASCARDLSCRLGEQGVEVITLTAAAASSSVPTAGGPVAGHPVADLQGAELIVAVGGDGTLLSANRIAAPLGIPILGVHAGGPASFGFLTETSPPAAWHVLQAVLAGGGRIEERLMVRADLLRDGKPIARRDGLNDLVIRSASRMLKLRVEVGGVFIATYAADGIIVAPPTGSTAYNLAAGGPIVHPSVPAILVTPICPHTLNVRSLLVEVDDEIRVRLDSDDRETTLLAVDGQVTLPMQPGDMVCFRRSELRGRCVSVDGPGFYKKVQTRLRLGERFGGP